MSQQVGVTYKVQPYSIYKGKKHHATSWGTFKIILEHAVEHAKSVDIKRCPWMKYLGVSVLRVTTEEVFDTGAGE